MWLKEKIKKIIFNKYNEKAIGYEERKSLQLDILQEVDKFCRAHSIKYCLGYGTMLGAVRHKGYIPWDDDIDLLMPYPDMLRFKKEFKSDKYLYADIDTYEHFEFSFSRILDMRTFSIRGPFFKFYGINIDIYPVLGLPEKENEICDYMKTIKEMLDVKSRYHKFQNVFNSRAPFQIFPMDCYLRKYRDFIVKYPYEKSTKYFCAGWPFADQIFDINYFDNLIEADFEGYKFYIPSEYDKYLKQRYGDYMQLPPEEERIAHHNRYYFWK